MFMTAGVFEARHCPTLPNEIKKTKPQIYISPQAGINILLVAGKIVHTLNFYFLLVRPSSVVRPYISKLSHQT
jgi:hypothetical protein